MATIYTARTKLAKPGVADRQWNLPLNANADLLDGLAPLGGLCVTPAEIPSASLNVQVAPGTYRRPDGTVGTFAGSASTAVAAGQTTSLYLTPDGVLSASTSGYPPTAHVRLATIVAGPAAIQTVADDRVTCGAVGTDALPFLPLAGGSLKDGSSVAFGTASGTRLGTSAAQKLAFWGATPVARPEAYTQVYTATTRTLAAYTPSVQTSAFAGIASGQAGSPYAQAADLNALRLACENLRLAHENLAQIVNALVDDLQAIGIVG
ncbi:MAG: hypothetical protein U0790_23790 [Isosphaeraceae bacterium]